MQTKEESIVINESRQILNTSLIAPVRIRFDWNRRRILSSVGKLATRMRKNLEKSFALLPEVQRTRRAGQLEIVTSSGTGEITGSEKIDNFRQKRKKQIFFALFVFRHHCDGKGGRKDRRERERPLAIECHRLI